VLFLYLENSHRIDHYDWTILASLYMSSIAVVISLWNALMFNENAFDPVHIELEMKRRQDQRHHSSLNNENETTPKDIKRLIASKF